VVSNEWLNGYELGFGSGLSPNGSDTALSGRTRVNGSDSDSASLRGACPRTTMPWRWTAGPRRSCACGEAGWATPKIRPQSRIQIRKHFSFSDMFYKLPINFNSNQI
jgi:hypothetical protein